MSFPKVAVGCVDVSARAKRYVLKALDDKRLSYGPFLKKFERRFAAIHGARVGVTCNSGTSALHAALAALQDQGGWKPGDEVLIPAVTFVAASNMTLLQGLKPVFVDVDPRTYNIDPARIERHITKRTRAIIPTHLFGQPADMDPVMAIARKRRLKVIEDSCETMFANYRGRPVGSFGDIACFSTYAAHILVTGVGGIAVTNSARLGVALRSLVNHGRDSIYISIDDDDDSDKLREIVAGRFSFVRMGFSYRLTEMEGALGLAQLEERGPMIRRRRANAEAIIEGLRRFEDFLQLPWRPEGVEHSYMMLPLVLAPGISKAKMTLFLERRGIETRDMLPLINQPYNRKLFGNLDKKYPVADRINKSGFYVGCHHRLGRREIDHLINSFALFFKNKKGKTA